MKLKMPDKKLIIPLAALAVLVLAAGLTLYFVLREPPRQAIDFRNNNLTSSKMEVLQNIADEAGRPGRGKIEFLSLRPSYVKDEEGKVTGLVVEGLLRNGYNTAVQLNTLDLTVKTADDKTEIAAAAFEGEYGVIPSRESIYWHFTFTEDFLFVTDADLSKVINHLTYTFDRK